MKAIVCEMCGSNKLLKDDGIYTCQSCGTMYSIEEARKLLVDGTVHIEGTVVIDRNEEYEKLYTLAKQSFQSRMFKQSYELSSQALKIQPNNPELIAIQGLSVLDIEYTNESVPSSSWSSIDRFFSSMKVYEASYQEKKSILKNVSTYVKRIVDYKVAGYNEQTRDLNKQIRSLYDESSASFHYSVSQGIEKQRALAELERIRMQNDNIENHNSNIQHQIRAIKKKISAMQKLQERYTGAISSLQKMIDQLEKREREEKKELYWKDRIEEKRELENQLKELNNKNQSIDKEISGAIKECDQIKKDITFSVSPLNKRKNEIKNKIRDLENERSGLGVFNKNRKNQINKEIEMLYKDIPSEESIDNDVKEFIKPFQEREKQVKEKIHQLQSDKTIIIQQINEISNKLNLRDEK